MNLRLFERSFDIISNEHNISFEFSSMSTTKFNSQSYEQHKGRVLKNYILEPIKVNTVSVHSIAKPTGEVPIDFEQFRGIYITLVKFTFTGSSYLLKFRPPDKAVNDFEFYDEHLMHRNSFGVVVKQTEPNVAEFEREKRKIERHISSNIESLNLKIIPLNNSVEEYFEKAFKLKIDAILAENNFFEAINITTNKETESILEQKFIEIKEAPQTFFRPTVSTRTRTPIISQEIYMDIIDTFKTFYKSVERKPCIFKDKGEDALRDYIIPTLEVRYQNSSVTTETFNSKGKTDILIKEKATNVFVAEFKMWTSPGKMEDHLKQLFGYITVRETKTAMVYFMKDKGFTNAWNQLRTFYENRPEFVSTEISVVDNCVTYVFSTPSDSEQRIMITLMAFHLDSKRYMRQQ